MSGWICGKVLPRHGQRADEVEDLSARWEPAHTNIVDIKPFSRIVHVRSYGFLLRSDAFSGSPP
jgi:hypothetical protein